MTWDFTPQSPKTLRQVVEHFFPEPPPAPPVLFEQVGTLDEEWFRGYKIFLEVQLEGHYRRLERSRLHEVHYKKVLSQAKRWAKSPDVVKDYRLAYKSKAVIQFIEEKLEHSRDAAKDSEHYISHYKEKLETLSEESARKEKEDDIEKDNQRRQANHELQCKNLEESLLRRKEALDSLHIFEPKRTRK